MAPVIFFGDSRDLASKTQAGFLIIFETSNQLRFVYSSHSVNRTIASDLKKSFFVSFTKHHSPSKRLNLSSSKSISSFFSFLQRSFSIWHEFTFGSLIKRIAPSSSKSLQILMAAASLVSFVFALNANP